jgi:hypothetical protein
MFTVVRSHKHKQKQELLKRYRRLTARLKAHLSDINRRGAEFIDPLLLKQDNEYMVELIGEINILEEKLGEI